MRSRFQRSFPRITRKDLFELFICIALAGLFVLLSSGTAFGQGNVGINNPTPHAKSLLDLTSNDKGLLTPRLTTAQRAAMFPTPDATAKGMLVYQTDGTQGYYYYDGATWQMLQAGGAGWGLLGNAGTNAATNFLGTSDGQPLSIRTNGAERMLIAANGNVGIGHNNPVYNLEVKSPVQAVTRLTSLNHVWGSVLVLDNTTPGTNALGAVNFGDGTATWGQLNYHLTNGMTFNTGALERMRIAPNGNVGIGTNITNVRLHVADNVNNVLANFWNANATGHAGVHYDNNSGGRAHIGFGGSTAPTFANVGYAGTVSAHPFVLSTSDQERMRIDAAGNVGIGTSAPARLVEIASLNQAVQRLTSNNAVNGSVVELRNTTAGNNGLGALNFLDGAATLGQVMYHKANGLTVNTASTERMRIDVNGNVGIGTTTPGSRLHVSRGSSGLAPHAFAGLTMESNNMLYQHFLIPDAAESGLLFGSGSNPVDAGVLYHTGYALHGLDFRTGGNATRMVITGAGDVGVGTIAPGLKLTVVNNTTSAGIGVVNQNTAGWSGILAAEATNNGHSVLGFGNSGNAFAGLGFAGTSTAHPFVLLSGNTERIRIATNGNVGIGTSAPTATLEVNGFTKHGSNAPAIRQVEFTGTTAATEGAFVDIAHGLTAGKIMDVRVLIEYTAGNWITTGYAINPEYLADFVIGAANIRIYNHNGSSGSILSKPVKVLVTYKA